MTDLSLTSATAAARLQATLNTTPGSSGAAVRRCQHVLTRGEFKGQQCPLAVYRTGNYCNTQGHCPIEEVAAEEKPTAKRSRGTGRGGRGVGRGQFVRDSQRAPVRLSRRGRPPCPGGP